MIIEIVKYLCIATLGTAILTSCLSANCGISHDPTARRVTPNMIQQVAIFEQEAQPVSFEYQLLTEGAEDDKLLLYLKDSVNTMTINMYDQMGRSSLLHKEQALSRGFYNFDLPNVTASNIQYWEVKLGNQRAVVFKK